MTLPAKITLTTPLRAVRQWRAAEQATSPMRDVVVHEDGLLEIDGTLASNTPCREYIRGVGIADVTLRVAPDVIEGWREHIPFVRNHGDWFGDIGLEHVIGRIDTMSAVDGQIRAKFWLDPDMGKTADGTPLRGPIERGILRDTSVRYAATELRLVEERDGDVPLYEATRWYPIEGSLVFAGRDPTTQLRSNMDPELITQIVRDALADANTPTVDVAAIASAVADKLGALRSEPIQGELLEAPAMPTAEEIARAVKAAIAPATPPEGEVTDTAHDIVARAAIQELGATEAAAIIAQAAGNADTLRGLVMAKRAANPPPTPPTAAPTSLQGGFPRRAIALRDLATVVLARGTETKDHKLRSERETAAAKVHPEWRNMTIAHCLERYARAIDHQLPVTRSKLFEQLMTRRHWIQDAEMIGGAQYLRHTDLGLVPGDLPAAFRDITYKELMAAYNKETLDMGRFARRKDTQDFRDQHMTHIDIAGNFDPLLPEEQLRRVTLRELEGTFSVDNYGYTHTIGRHAIINDDLGITVQVPARLGLWMAAGENKKFQEVVAAGIAHNKTTTNYTGNRLISVADPEDYDTHLWTIRQRALAAVAVPALSGQDPKHDPMKTRELVPDIILYGSNHEKTFYKYMANRERLTRESEAIRNPYEETLWSMRGEGLYLGVDDYYVWPGGLFNPFCFGRVIGYGLEVELRETGPHDQKGIVIVACGTFGAAMTFENRAYKVTKP